MAWLQYVVGTVNLQEAEEADQEGIRQKEVIKAVITLHSFVFYVFFYSIIIQ